MFAFALIALAAVAAALFVRTVFNTVSERYAAESSFDGIIKEVAERNGIDPRLIKAVIWKESRFDRLAIGGKGEIGLMQVMPKFALKEWADANGVENISDGVLSNPEMNIEVGSWYLARALRYWKDYSSSIELALCEYNAGRSRAEAWKPVTPDGKIINRIDIASTKTYVTDIMKKYAEYKKTWNPGEKSK